MLPIIRSILTKIGFFFSEIGQCEDSFDNFIEKIAYLHYFLLGSKNGVMDGVLSTKEMPEQNRRMNVHFGFPRWSGRE